MRWKACRITLLAGLVGLPLLTAGTAHAAPADISGARQVVFDACHGKAAPVDSAIKCVVRASGDFNGDGFDDLIVERMDISEFLMGRALPIAMRQIDVLFGPFAQTAIDQPAAAAASALRLNLEQPFVPMTVVDLNQDGLDDLVLAADYQTTRQGGAPVPPDDRTRVSVVLGQDKWPLERDLLDGRAADIVIERLPRAAGSDPNTKLPRAAVTTAFADVNGDGRLDLLVATDFGSLFANASVGRQVGTPPRNPASAIPSTLQSTVAVMFGKSEGWPARAEFHADATFAELGLCVKSLAGAGDVTGDGIADIVLRQCGGGGLPDALRVVPGVGPDIGCPGLAGVVRLDEPAWPDWKPVGPALPVDPARIVSAMHASVGGTGGSYAAVAGAADADGDVPPPDPGRGYLQAGAPGSSPPFFLDDVDGDGVLDIALGFGQNTHIWLGGPDVVDKVARQHTDRVFVGVGFGDLDRTSGWRSTDLDGDGRRDWLLTDFVPNATTVSNNQVTFRTFAPPTLHLYRGGRPALDVVDLLFDEPEARWEKPSMPVWAMGDFDNDGHTDLLLGDTVNLARSMFAVAYGPLAGQ